MLFLSEEKITLASMLTLSSRRSIKLAKIQEHIEQHEREK